MKPYMVTALVAMAAATMAAAGTDRVTVGSGTQYYPRPALGRPFGPDPQRYQMLILADELDLQPGDRITALAFDGAVFARKPIQFKAVAIRIAATENDGLTDTFADNAGAGAQRVLTRPELELDQLDRGWLTLVFDQAFTYSGGHLVIEFRHAGGTGVFRTTRWSRPPGRTLDSVGLDGSTGGPDAERGILRDYMSAAKLHIERAP